MKLKGVGECTPVIDPVHAYAIYRVELHQD